MVTIRRLQPSVGKIRLPEKVFDPLRDGRRPGRPNHRGGRQIKVVRRRLVDFPAPTPQPTPCRLWQGVTDRYGYGLRWTDPDDEGGRRRLTMHRWIMEQVMGRPLTPNEVILHLCDQRLCFRADHLRVGTVSENNADMFAKGRASPPPQNVFHGEQHPNSKLTWKQVRRIRRDAEAGVLPQLLAIQYGVSVYQVKKILSGRAWKELDDDGDADVSVPGPGPGDADGDPDDDGGADVAP